MKGKGTMRRTAREAERLRVWKGEEGERREELGGHALKTFLSRVDWIKRERSCQGPARTLMSTT